MAAAETRRLVDIIARFGRTHFRGRHQHLAECNLTELHAGVKTELRNTRLRTVGLWSNCAMQSCRRPAAHCAALLDAGAAMQVGFDLKSAAATEPRAIDLQILHDSLHVVARLGERNLFDPVD